MTFSVKFTGTLIELHGGSPEHERRYAAPWAVVSTVDHADIRGLVTASLSSV